MPVTINVPGLGPTSIPDSVPLDKTEDYVRQLAQQRGIKLDLPPPPPAPDKSYGVLPALRDVGVSAAGIVPGLIETAAEFTPTDRALGAIGVDKGIAGLLSGTEYGKDVGKYGVLRGTAKSLRDLQQEMFSEQGKAAQKEYQRKLAEASKEGFMSEAGTAFKETLTNPELLATNLPESLLSMLGGRAVAKVGEKAIKAVAPEAAKEAGEKLLGKAAEKLGPERVAKLQKFTGGPETIRTVAGGAAMQGASVANQNFIATMDMPEAKLAATQEYQEAVQSGLSPEEARLSVARSAANGALLPATAISIVAQYAVPGGTSFERLFAGATERTLGVDTALQVAKQIGKSTLGEAGSEAVEEGGGQFIGNVFTPGQEDLTQGVGAAAGAAGALGALMGGSAGGVHALQAKRAQQVIEERKQQEEQARQELDARMPPVQQIEHPETTQLAPEQISSEAGVFLSTIPAGDTFTLDTIANNTSQAVAGGGDATAVANHLLNTGEIVREPGDTLSFRRVNDNERVVPLGNPNESYVYTVPTTREGSELNDGYTIESSALGVTRQAANQEEADKIKQAMLDRAGERAAVVDEQLNNLRAQADEVSRTITEAYTRPDISDVQLQQLRTTGEQTTQKLNDEIAKLEEQKAAILAEPTVTPINPRAETGHEVRLHTPGQPARVLNKFATEQEAYDAIIDNSTPEQDRLIAEDPAYENVRRRLEERAAELDAAEEEAPQAEPVQMTPEMQERVTQTANRMRGVLDQMGLKNIGLNVQQRLQEMVNGKLSNVDGYYLNRVIAASLEGSRDVTATIGHETIHALRELGMFSDKEWETLTKRAKSEWIKKYRIRERYQGMLTEEKVIEEAIADAFGDWLQGDLKERGVIAGLFNRIKLFMEKFGSVLRGQGFTTSSDIFKRARTGTLEGDRVERVAEGKQYARDFRDVTVRTPELQQAAERLKAGEITSEEYNRLVDKYKPIAAFEEVPTPATKEEMSEALTSDKVARIGEPSRTLKGGENVGLRLDIPAYRDYGTWVVSVHEKGTAAGAGKSIGYEPVAAVTNANFSVNPKAALNIAAGKPKATIATVEGKWKPIDVKQAYKQAKEAMTSPDWIQVGMDPERHSYFYNRDTTQPVVSADEVIQIGGLVLAKNPVYAEKSEFQFALPRTINVDGKERPTTNSEGRPIHPTEEGVRNFWKWFGDSKAVDDNGNPLVVYHGAKSDIERFEFKTKDFKNTYVTTDKNFPNWKVLRGIYKQTGEDLLLARWHEYNTSGQFPELDNIISVQTASGEIESVKLNGRSAVSVVRSLVNNPRYVSERIAGGHRAFFFSEDPVYTGFYSVWGGRDYDRRPTTYPVYIKVEKPINKNSWSDFEPFYKKATKNNPQKMDLAKSAFLNERWEAMEAFPGLIEYAKQKGYDGYQLVEGGASAFGYSPVTEVAPGGVNTWAVFKPAQVKSAVGNRGAFSPTDKRIQYALPQTVNVDGVERPTRISEEARAGAAVSGNDIMEGMGIPEEERSQYWRNLSQEERDALFEKYYRSVSGAGRVIHPTIEGVKNFWRWFGNSKIVNKDGTPKVMYHGTARDISEFRKQQANAIFVTEDPEFAKTFADMSRNWMVTNATQVLDEQTLKLAIERGIRNAGVQGFVTKKAAAEWLNKHEVLSLKNRLKAALMSPMADFVSESINDELPSRDNIIQVYVRAEKTFDYDSQEDRDALMAWAKSLDKNNPARQFIEDKKNEIEFGEWEVIESPAVQDFIKSNGYDSFYMYETGRKNLAVFDPNQLKSAVGNTGAFSRISGDIQYALPFNQLINTASLDESNRIAKSKSWSRGRDLKMELQNRVLDAASKAKIDITKDSEETRQYLREVGLKDALSALRQNPNAIGWYDLKTRQALAVMSLVHPEILGSENNRFAFTWALAVTSNGIKVDKNFELAEQAYVYYKQYGVMPTNIGVGTAKTQINNALALFNELQNEWGINSFRKFMQTNFTVKEITGISKALKPSGEHADVTVKGAAIIGPKIGNGFFSNLYGDFDSLTMDRWLIRTWGRWTGTLIKSMPEQTQKATDRLSENVSKILNTPEEAQRLGKLIGFEINEKSDLNKLAQAVQKASMIPSIRSELNKTDDGLELRKAGNSLAKYLDGQKEAPENPDERKYIRAIFKDILNKLKERREYQNLTMADLQAVLWYAEKRLYETAKESSEELKSDEDVEGYADEEAPDYANAAAKVARQNGVDELDIIETLKRIEDERPRAAGLTTGEGVGIKQTSGTGQQGTAGGFTGRERKIFIGERAVLRARADRKSDAKQPEAYSREGDKNGGSVRLLKSLGVSYINVWKINKQTGNIFRANKLAAPEFFELSQDLKNAQKFRSAIAQNKARHPYGAAVTVYPAKEYAKMRLFLSEDGNSGVAIKPDGDVVSVFSTGGAGRAIMELAVAAGGKKLDAFDTMLPELYAAHGFRAVARTKWNNEFAPKGWNKKTFEEYNEGEPDVVFMVYDPEKIDSKYSRQDGLLITGDNDYDRAVETQNSVVQSIQYALPQNILGQRATLPTWTSPTDDKVDSLIIYNLQDKNIDLKRVIQNITKAVGNIADRWNPYLQEELYHGRTARQTERFLRDEVSPLLKDLNNSNITLDELDEYLHNRHAKERNDQIASINPNLPDGGSGITTQNALNYLNALPQQRRMLLERLARRVDDINKATRQILVQSGLETPQTIAAWEQTYKNYVPLFREDADYVTSSGYGVGRGFDIRGDFSKQAVGSTRKVVDIFANVVMQRERAIIRAEKNNVAKALYGLAVQNPNKDFWMVIDPEGIKDVAQVRNDLMNLGINPNDVANIFQQPTQARVDPKTGLVTNKLDPFVLKSDNVMAVRIDGKNKYIMFNNNDPRAQRMVTSLKNMDADQLGRTLSMISKVTRFIASINTQYNPVFGVINLFRDVGGATLNLTSTPIADKTRDVMSATNLSGAMKGIWSATRAERKGGAQPASQWAKLWRELQEEGGQTGFRSQFSSSQERAEALQDEINSITAGKAKKVFFGMRDILSDYNTAMENAVRLSAYKAALDKKLSKQQAASVAKNITVNFNRKGQVATQMGALYAFFNASVQGTARLAETLTNGRDPNASPYSLSRYFGPKGQMIINGALLVGALQTMMLAAAGFDDDEPPEFIKERNFIIPTGWVTGKKDYLTVPLPLGFNLLPNISRHLTEFWFSGFKNPAKHVADLTGSALEVFNPIGSAGWSAQTLTPTILDPYVALRENKDSFGRPIAREDMSGLDPTPGYTRAKDTATSLSKGLSVFLNAASGGTKYKPGVISPTPDQIDYLLGQAGGGVYRELSKVEQTASAWVTGEELAPYKMPLIGRFYNNSESNAVQAQRFYENLTRLNEHENEIKGRIKNREPIGDYFKEHPEARLYKAANSVEYNIRKLKQRRELLKERGGNEQAIKNINDSIVRLMKRLNEQVEKMEG